MLSIWETLIIICRKPCVGDTNSKRFQSGERGSREALRGWGGGKKKSFIGKVTNAIDRPSGNSMVGAPRNVQARIRDKQHDRVSKEINQRPHGLRGVSFYTHLRMWGLST